MFSWLGELVPVFWLMELGLLSLKSSAVSSSRFWAIKGFSVSLDSPSVFDSVRHVYLHSCFQVALSTCLTAASPLLVPGIIADASVPLSYAALMAEACWVGACVDIFSVLWPSPLHCGVLFGASLSPLSSPSVSWGLCALVSASWALPLHCGACVHLFQLPRPALCIAELVCTGFGSLDALCCRACVHLFHLSSQPSLSRGLCVLLLAPQADPLYGESCVHCPRFVSLPSLGTLACPWCHKGCVHWLGLYAMPHLATQACPLYCRVSMGFSWFPEPSVWLGPQSPSCSRAEKSWAEKCRFFCFLPSKSLLCLGFWDSTAPPWAHLWENFLVHGHFCSRTPSCPQGTSSCPEVLCLLFFYAFILSLTSFQGV